MATDHLRNITAYHADHDDGDEATNELIIAKVTAILVLGLVSFIIGIFPLHLNKCLKWQIEQGQSLIISLMLCFGGGVLMFTTFLHLQPEVRAGMEDLYQRHILPEVAENVQLAELIFCIGFFFVYFIEEVVHSLLDHKHHTEDEAILHRTMSIRSCSRRGTHHDPPTLIPRVSLNQSDAPSKSISTQVLIDNSSAPSTVSDNTEYFPKVLDAELALNFPKSDSKFHNHHSHMMFDDDSEDGDSSKLGRSVRAFCTILALSFHAVFEGLAVGLESSVTNVWYLTLAVAAHKFVISFCVGVELVSNKTRMFLTYVYVGTFAAVSPIGIGLGILLSHSSTSAPVEVATVVLQGMAAGTLLYVVFFEVLQREKANRQSGVLQLIAIITGFGVMFGLQVLTGHSHSHEHTETEILLRENLHDHLHDHH